MYNIHIMINVNCSRHALMSEKKKTRFTRVRKCRSIQKEDDSLLTSLAIGVKIICIAGNRFTRYIITIDHEEETR